MIKLRSSQIKSGIVALMIYFFLIALIIFYFNSRDEDKSKVYVKKNEKRIEVGLSPSPIIEKRNKVKKNISKNSVEKKSQKRSQKKVIKEKIVKRKKILKKEHNSTKPKKKTNPKDLFSNINATRKSSFIKITDKPIRGESKSNYIKISTNSSATKHIDNSLKGQRKGVNSAYLSKVQSMLEGWPAQSDYAGEKVKVILHIHPSGFFEFKIKSASRNWDFNRGLTEYLEQLQSYGFGKHNGGRIYNFEAEFIAKE